LVEQPPSSSFIETIRLRMGYATIDNLGRKRRASTKDQGSLSFRMTKKLKEPSSSVCHAGAEEFPILGDEF